MMKPKRMFETLSYLYPFERRSSLDWIVPASIGIGIGIAAGVGIGVLIAPSSGEAMRQRLKEGAGKVKERARLAAQRAAEQRPGGQGKPAGAIPGDVSGLS